MFLLIVLLCFIFEHIVSATEMSRDMIKLYEFSSLSALFLCLSSYTLACSMTNSSLKCIHSLILFVCSWWASTTWKWHARCWTRERVYNLQWLLCVLLSEKLLSGSIVCEETLCHLSLHHCLSMPSMS